MEGMDVVDGRWYPIAFTVTDNQKIPLEELIVLWIAGAIEWNFWRDDRANFFDVYPNLDF